MHSDSWETKWRLNYITNTVTPLPSQSSRTHVARRTLPQLLRTCQRDDAGDVSPGILGDASVVAKVLLGQILYVQTHFHLQCTKGKSFNIYLQVTTVPASGKVLEWLLPTNGCGNRTELKLQF